LNSDESRLRRDLLDGYVSEARPVINASTITVVDVGLTIIQVMDLASRLYPFTSISFICFVG
jgi:hypothetical protein